MKRTIFFIQILLLLTAGSAFGADEYIPPARGPNPNFHRTFWFKGTGSHPWDGLGGESWWDNQQGHFPPDACDVASIDNPIPATCVVDSDANCLALYIGNWPANSQSTGGGEVPQTATLDVNDANLTVVEDVMIGMRDTTLPSDYAIGDFNIISGTVTVGLDLYIGREGIGYLNMRGGTLDVNGTIWCPGWELPEYLVVGGSYGTQTYIYGTGYLNLYGGTITADDLQVYDEDGGETYINIAGGTLILNGDKRSNITDLINQGKMFHGYGGNIEFDYNVSNPGKTTVIGTFDPNCATYPDPQNYGQDVSLTTDLIWKVGINANDVNGHDVYFGTSFADVNDANNTPGAWAVFQGNQDSNTYDPCAGELDPATTYYWRIDEVNGPAATTWPGNVWKFTTVDPYLASNPDPAHRLIEVPIEKILRWNVGIAANSHEVYLGTSFDDVNTSTTPTATTPNALYKPTDHLLFDETYYWRVDEVNTVTDTNWPGPVWRFKTFPYKDVDDMDNFEVWTPAGGASVSKVTNSPLNDTKALKLDYSNTNSPWDSNCTRSFRFSPVTNRRDWVSGGVEIFQIRFHGEPDNDVEQLYVTLKDADGNTATVLYSDSNHIVKQEHELWRVWSIDIEDFNDGINIADIRYFTLGLGDGVDPGATVTGTVYFDEIELYRPMCINRDGDADITNDCKVNMRDIEVLEDGWLKAPYDVNINLGTYDMNVGLILWYKFDEGSGYDLTDSSGYGHTGSMGLDNWETVDCVDGNCVYFLPPGDQMWITVPPAAAPNDLGGHSTVALWIKDAGVETEFAPFDQIGSQLFQAGPAMEGNLQASFQYNGHLDYICGWDIENSWEDAAGWGEDGYSNPEHPLNEWVHYAFVKDANGGVIRSYQNGKIVAEEYDATALKMPDVNPNHPDDYSKSWFTIGAWRWFEGTGGYYVGLMDDFRLYNRALSQQEVMDLAGVSSVHQLVVSYAELTGDGKVNFLDYAVVAAEWLENPLLWPY